MLHNTPPPNPPIQALPFQAKMTTNRSFLLEDNELPLPQLENKNFKFHQLLNKASQHTVLKQGLRFLVYTLLLLLVLSFMDRSSNSMIYSFISRDSVNNMMSLTKQIPGIFPPLNPNWENLLTKWNITLLSGNSGPLNLKLQNYQLQFKHTGQQRQNVVYITKGNCKGHIMMNWQVHSNNIYLTTFQTPKEDYMLILNQPEDELCIKENQVLFNLLYKATIWTTTEEKQIKSLFLLIEQTDQQNQVDNWVLISQKASK